LKESPTLQPSMTKEARRGWHHLPLALFGLTLVIIAVGGTIRIYDAGESCPEWPTCFGSWSFDVSEDEQRSWYAANPDDVDSRGAGHTYTSFQIFTEWFHRILAGTILGPLVLLQWYIVFRRRDSTDYTEQTGGRGLSPTAVRLAMLSAILVAIQGALGALTVWLDNEHWSVVLHLAMALAFAAVLLRLWLVWMRDIGCGPIRFDIAAEATPAGQRLAKRRLFEAAISTISVMLLGAFVSTTPGANLGCGVAAGHANWPMCNGRMVEMVTDFAAQSQMIHRFLVVAVLVHLTVLNYQLPKWLAAEGVSEEGARSAKRMVGFGSLIFLTNVFIGMSYIISWSAEEGFPEWLSVVHLMLGSLTFLTFMFGAFLAADHREQKPEIDAEE